MVRPHEFCSRIGVGVAVALLFMLSGCSSQPAGGGSTGSEPEAEEPTPGASGGNTEGGTGAPSPATGDFVTSPRQGANVLAPRVTVFGKLPTGATGVMISAALARIQSDATYFVPNVPLDPGHNTLVVMAVDAGQKPVSTATLEVNRTGDEDPVQLGLPQGVLQVGQSVEITVESPLVVSTVMADFDGDGRPDVSGADTKPAHTYTKAGRYPVSATIKTDEGLYFTSDLGPLFNPVNQLIVGLETKTVGTLALADVTDIEIGPRETIWVLTARELVHVTSDLAITKRLALPAGVSGAGFGIAVDGSFAIADAAGNRLLKLNAASVADPQFGAAGFVNDLGSDHGRLAGPVDVAVDGDGNVHVLDAGNARIVTLGPSGDYIKEVGIGPSGKRLVEYAGMLYFLGGAGTLGVYTKQLTPVEGMNLPGDGTTSIYPSRDGYQFAFGMSEGKVYLTDSVGGVLATLSTGASSVLNAVTVQEDTGPAIIVATSSGQVCKIAIPQDSSDTSPTGVWQAFMEKLSAGDIDGALVYVEPGSRIKAQRALLRVPSDALPTIAQRYGRLTFVERADSYAFYTAIVDGGVRVRSIGFVRDPQSLRWFIRSF